MAFDQIDLSACLTYAIQNEIPIFNQHVAGSVHMAQFLQTQVRSRLNNKFAHLAMFLLFE